MKPFGLKIQIFFKEFCNQNFDFFSIYSKQKIQSTNQLATPARFRPTNKAISGGSKPRPHSRQGTRFYCSCCRFKDHLPHFQYQQRGRGLLCLCVANNVHTILLVHVQMRNVQVWNFMCVLCFRYVLAVCLMAQKEILEIKLQLRVVFAVIC